MTKILVIKEQLKQFYSKFDIYIVAIFKFIAGFIAVSLLNSHIGYMDKINNAVVVLVISLICSILPIGGMVLICAALVLAHFYTISLELAAIALIVFLLMFCLYTRFDSSYTYLILLTPILFWMKIPYLVPLLAGLTAGIPAAVPVGFGVIVYYMIDYVELNAPSLSNSTTENMLQKFTLIIDGLIQNKLMLLTVVAFAATVIIVYIIKSLSVDYSWTIAVITGTIVEIAVLLVGEFSLDISASVLGIILGSIISAIIIMILQIFIFAVDYTRTEYVQFEDDDYVYYVKAVPKMSVTTPEVNVKRINAQKTRKPIK